MSVQQSIEIGAAQVVDWQDRGISIIDAATSLDRRPPDQWRTLALIVAAEHLKATRILKARGDRRSACASGSAA